MITFIWHHAKKKEKNGLFLAAVAHYLLCVLLQVTEETSGVLQKLGYSCECRGFINVKGKGELKTFFVCTDMSKQQGMGLS